MKKITEGRKMFIIVMAIFLVYAAVFIIFDDYERNILSPLNDVSDWHLLIFAVVVITGMGFLLHHYSRRMDARISREQAEKQNEMRRQLTQNISHELKTPVASIMGYTETMIENPSLDEKTKLQFINRCHAQAQRLTLLLQDLSTLNRMDYAPDLIEMSTVNIANIVNEISQETAFAAKQKQISFENHLANEVIVEGNAPLLYSIFRNLIDNAINYAGERTTITLFAVEHSDEWLFTFFDNGLGISPEHLPRLFERFYRIDKGRSRTMGGTGLGLAIVKNAVMIHGGTISARNEHGLRFEFTIKKKQHRN